MVTFLRLPVPAGAFITFGRETSMKAITFYFRAALLLIIVGAVAGCAHQTHGKRIDQETVSQIKKGVTTKDEVEALLGPPTNISMLGDGRRMMLYNFMEVSTQATATSFIPFVGGLIGGAGQQRTQSLQIIITKSGVVEDYEYLDRLENSEGGLSNRRTVEQPTK